MQNAIPVIFVREHMSSHHIYLALSLEFVCLFVCLCGDTKAKRDSSPGSIPMLSSWTRLVNLTVTLSTQEYKWVPVSFPQKVRRTGG